MVKISDFQLCLDHYHFNEYDKYFTNVSPRKKSNLIKCLHFSRFLFYSSVTFPAIAKIIWKIEFEYIAIDFLVYMFPLFLGMFMSYLLFNLTIGNRLNAFIEIRKQEKVREKDERAAKKAAKKAAKRA